MTTSNNDQIITLQTYYDPMLAQIIRAKLEANGIECFLSDESMTALNPLFDVTTAGVKLNVLARDAERARAVIEAHDSIEE